MERRAIRERDDGASEPSVGDLVGRLVSETKDLLELEIARLRAEVIEKSAAGVANGLGAAVVAVIAFVALQAAAVGAVIGFGILLGSFVAGAFVAAAAILVFGLVLFAALRLPIRRMVAGKLGAVPAPRELPEPSRSAGALPERASHSQGVTH